MITVAGFGRAHRIIPKKPEIAAAKLPNQANAGWTEPGYSRACRSFISRNRLGINNLTQAMAALRVTISEQPLSLLFANTCGLSALVDQNPTFRKTK